jgi:hypothetical protein
MTTKSKIEKIMIYRLKFGRYYDAGYWFRNACSNIWSKLSRCLRVEAL